MRGRRIRKRTIRKTSVEGGEQNRKERRQVNQKQHETEARKQEQIYQLPFAAWRRGATSVCMLIGEVEYVNEYVLMGPSVTHQHLSSSFIYANCTWAQVAEKAGNGAVRKGKAGTRFDRSFSSIRSAAGAVFIHQGKIYVNTGGSGGRQCCTEKRKRKEHVLIDF